MTTRRPDEGDDYTDDAGFHWNPSGDDREGETPAADDSLLADIVPRQPGSTAVSPHGSLPPFPNRTTRVPRGRIAPRGDGPPSGLEPFGRFDDEHSADFVLGGLPDASNASLEDSLFGPTRDYQTPRPKHVPEVPPTTPGPAAKSDETVAKPLKEKRKREGKIRYPKPGEAIGGFRIIAELGRGAFARVYHAEQLELANRPVALKVSRAEGDEPRVLARLQHTHIVPIHSVHDDPATGLRLMCMPYHGGANLAQVLDAAQEAGRGESKGRSLVDALDRIGKPCVQAGPKRAAGRRATASNKSTILRPDPSRIRRDKVAEEENSRPPKPHLKTILDRLNLWSRTPDDDVQTRPFEEGGEPIEHDLNQPNRLFLRGASFVRASVWIIARLAEGLEHAHARGLLHRDLKPSNILITADGTPMLLDFNLAADTPDFAREDGEKARLGGTLPYMAPEHLDAFNLNGKTTPEMVDERSDLYALGLILFEMVAGRYPFSTPPDDLSTTATLKYMMDERYAKVPSLREANPRVPWSLDAIVRKALAPDCEERYQSAREFAEDLRRFLQDEPLLYTDEPSVRERAAKWARRHPRAASITGVGTVLGGVILMLGLSHAALTGSFHRIAARVNLRVFESGFQECQFLLNTTSAGSLTDHLQRGIKKAKELRDRFGVDRSENWTGSIWLTSLAPREQEEVRRDIAELSLLEARARVVLSRGKSDKEKRDALTWAVTKLDQAERFAPEPIHSLYRERAEYETAMGDAEKARADRARADKIPPTTCRDLYLTATSELAKGNPDRAETLLNQAAGLDQRRYWTWFALGLCRLAQGRNDAAANDFTVCALLMPEFAWSHLNRGAALAKAGRLSEAKSAYAKALQLSPDFTEALVHRGLVELELGEAADAEKDLERAISLGRGDKITRAALAESLAKQGRYEEAIHGFDALIQRYPLDPMLLASRGMARVRREPALAEADFRAALESEPGFAQARLGLARVLASTDPAEAWTQADLAVKGMPGLIDALELRMMLGARTGKGDAVKDVDRVLQAPTPRRIYNAACALAILGDANKNDKLLDRAAETLRRALDAGFPRETAESDEDLSPIRGRW